MTLIPEKVVKSESVFNGKLLHVQSELVRFRDGSEATREIVEHAGAVAIVPIENDMVYLVRQYRSAAKRITLEIPAGTLKPGEKPRETAEREIEEEIGYRASKWTALWDAYVSPGYSTEKMFFFLAEDLRKTEQHLDVDEEIEVVPVQVSEIPERIKRGDISDIKSLLGLLWLETHWATAR